MSGRAGEIVSGGSTHIVWLSIRTCNIRCGEQHAQPQARFKWVVHSNHSHKRSSDRRGERAPAGRCSAQYAQLQARCGCVVHSTHSRKKFKPGSSHMPAGTVSSLTLFRLLPYASSSDRRARPPALKLAPFLARASPTIAVGPPTRPSLALATSSELASSNPKSLPLSLPLSLLPPPPPLLPLTLLPLLSRATAAAEGAGS
jgi:hypothetical protein